MPVVQATFVAAAVKNDRPLAMRLETAMAAAVAACHEQGVVAPEEIKAAMMAAYRAEIARG